MSKFFDWLRRVATSILPDSPQGKTSRGRIAHTRKAGSGRRHVGAQNPAGSKLARKAAEHRLGAPAGRQVYPHGYMSP